MLVRQPKQKGRLHQTGLPLMLSWKMELALLLHALTLHCSLAGFQLKHLSPSSVGHPKENVNHLLHLVGSDVVLPCAMHACQTFYCSPKKKEQKRICFF